VNEFVSGMVDNSSLSFLYINVGRRQNSWYGIWNLKHPIVDELFQFRVISLQHNM